MAYRVFFTDGEPIFEGPNPTAWRPRSFSGRDDAIADACVRVDSGQIVWKIEGDDGFLMERAEIEVLCRKQDID